MMDAFELISLAAGGGYLILCTVSDLRKKSIPLPLAAGGPVCSAVWMLFRITRENMSWAEFVSAGMPGALMMGLSMLTGGRVGLGDGMVLLAIGFLLGFRDTSAILLIGLLLSSFWSVILLVRKKAEKESRIPWMPFLLAGYIASTAWNIYGSVLQSYLR